MKSARSDIFETTEERRTEPACCRGRLRPCPSEFWLLGGAGGKRDPRQRPMLSSSGRCGFPSCFARRASRRVFFSSPPPAPPPPPPFLTTRFSSSTTPRRAMDDVSVLPEDKKQLRACLLCSLVRVREEDAAPAPSVRGVVPDRPRPPPDAPCTWCMSLLGAFVLLTRLQWVWSASKSCIKPLRPL
ncbi:MAG: hypothetical protein BJ554DRAFT_5331 [Olpidium bornovanus]|uniref:Uncharacterized protein n=1 Tax=Olpidium bornovanus TaxID=278681 RepID=A0A8H8DL59_9FUNG|nr:MAG: hypothetical protein BJ554DRAFT_5331 [Olpidium bornovanus]